MGLDLTLMPFDADQETTAFSHSLLMCDRDDDLFDRVMAEEKALGKLVPERFHSFRSREGGRDSHYGVTTRTPYGDPLRCLHARAIVDCFSETADLSERNAAIRAYLDHLNPTTRVALFWH